MATAQTNQREQRDVEVLRWRFEELRRAGFETEDALIVAADAKIDLHLATRLLRRGCPPDTALRILL
jgi:xanthine/CO dehydrogenase XdhC/CoxF family maturation factor